LAVVALLAALALVATACGDDSGSDTTQGTTAATTTTTSSGSTDTTAATGGPDPIAAAAAAAADLGLQFATSREEILAGAEAEGRVVVQTSTDEFDAFEEAFEAEYPFIDLEWAELSGSATERFLLELDGGAAGRQDVGYPAPEAYNTIADLMDWDLYGMAEVGILDIPLGSIDASRRTVLAAGHTGIALAYNRDLIAEADLPQTWEDLSDPKWADLGMSLDVDLNNVSVLATAWGIDRVTELMSAIAANEPTYVDGHTAAATLVQSGEVAISPFINLHSLMRKVDEDPEGPLQVHFVEPVPIRASEAYGVYDSSLAEAPYASLLFIEWIANSDVAQELLDADPLQASLFWTGSRMAEMIGDLETTIAGPAEVALLPDWISAIQEAAGFPTIAGG
jgi:iron(III) transport system substrate-binding protein